VVATVPVVTHGVVAVADDRGSVDAPLASRLGVFYPSDPSALLHRLGFPDWWPTPDTMLTDPAGRSTFLEIDSKIDELGHVIRTTSWAVVGNDSYDASTRWIRRLALAGDVGAPGDDISSATVDGVETTRYARYFSLDVGFLELVVTRGGDRVAAGQMDVSLLQIVDRRRSAARVVAGIPRALLAALPASPGLDPNATQLLATTSGGHQQRGYRIELAAPRAALARVRTAVHAWAATVGATVRPGRGDDVHASDGRLGGELADVTVAEVRAFARDPGGVREEFATRVVVELWYGTS
jgi:hypothetical protein